MATAAAPYRRLRVVASRDTSDERQTKTSRGQVLGTVALRRERQTRNADALQCKAAAEPSSTSNCNASAPLPQTNTTLLSRAIITRVQHAHILQHQRISSGDVSLPSACPHKQAENETIANFAPVSPQFDGEPPLLRLLRRDVHLWS
jgi:hypothetical protein